MNEVVNTLKEELSNDEYTGDTDVEASAGEPSCGLCGSTNISETHPCACISADLDDSDVTGDAFHTCSTCGRTFDKISQLQRHNATHKKGR